MIAAPLPGRLGDPVFCADHSVRHAYVAGSMVKGIASVELVLRMGRAGLLAFFGAGGLSLEEIDRAIGRIRSGLSPERSFGVNFLHNMLIPHQEDELVDLLLARDIRRIEASAFVQVTPALVRYRLAGLRAGSSAPRLQNRILGKASHPKVAEQFLAPPPPAIVAALHASGRITDEAARLAAHVPLVDDLCAEADSGGHTDRRVALTLLPHFVSLRDEVVRTHGLAQRVRIGLAGGLGTPEAIAAAFVLGADFVLTGSINQCTVEAGTSDAVKDLLAQADLHDMEMSPAGDMFEIGGKVQVLRRGTLFAGRANRLLELYRRYDSLDDIPSRTLTEIERRYFGRSLADVWAETEAYYRGSAPAQLAEALANPKVRMAMVFRWYFVHSNRLALEGSRADAANFQIHCGPAMGALNRWLGPTPLADWRRRHVDELAERLMTGAAEVLAARLVALTGQRLAGQPVPEPALHG